MITTTDCDDYLLAMSSKKLLPTHLLISLICKQISLLKLLFFLFLTISLSHLITQAFCVMLKSALVSTAQGRGISKWGGHKKAGWLKSDLAIIYNIYTHY